MNPFPTAPNQSASKCSPVHKSQQSRTSGTWTVCWYNRHRTGVAAFKVHACNRANSTSFGARKPAL